MTRNTFIFKVFFVIIIVILLYRCINFKYIEITGVFTYFVFEQNKTKNRFKNTPRILLKFFLLRKWQNVNSYYKNVIFNNI